MSHVVLRRVSWMVFFGVALVGLGIGAVVAVLAVSAANGFREGWQAIPVFLAIAGFIGRIGNCKVIIRDEVLTVVNPLRTHILPKSAIRGVSVDGGGTLRFHLDQDREISSFAFGGSLIDHFVGSSGKAERKVEMWLRADRAESAAAAEAVAPQARWTRCTSADAAIVLGVVVAAVGGIWMAFTSS
ncbi:PH domain-containing protein [Streptomyces griseus]|uniref:PH domain-containing protein n=1 Tax=Streptomyces stephensoniae TaxID=3375367 RepID=A0ABU2VXV2_9ACTN|nr:PH domain-containing protein [Streptomyces griseus]MDT0489931.1 PH domain-containing protein [Streptomyces griseus]